MTRLLVLDLGNVLLRVDFTRFAARAIAAGSTREPKQILDVLVAGPWKRDHDAGRVSTEEWFARASEWLGLSWDAAAFGEAWGDIFEEMPGAAAFVDRQTSEREVWLLSDTDPIHVDFVLRAFPWLRRLKRLLLSYQVGKLKHDAGAFEGLIAAAGRPADEIVFVDDLETNISCAKHAGIHAVRFERWDVTGPAVDELLAATPTP